MKKKFTFLFFILGLILSPITFSQLNSASDFFPSSIGNRWIYDIPPDGSMTMEITKDSLGTDKSRFLFYNSDTPACRIDSSGCILYSMSNSLTPIKYILNSDSGATWTEVTDSAIIEARVSGVYPYFILGKSRIVKQICYYKYLRNDTTLLDNFSDGDYKGWTVSSGSFSVNDSVLNPLSLNKYSLVCNKTGVISIPSKQAYGIWEFDYYKGNSGNRIEVDFIADSIGNYLNQNGYYFTDNSAGLIALVETSKGKKTDIMGTENNFTADHGVWYRIKIKRDINGLFTLYIKGGNFGLNYVLLSVVSGTNPALNNAYKLSNCFVLDVDSGDRISNVLCKKSENNAVNGAYYGEVWLVDGIGEYYEYSASGGMEKILKGCVINGDTLGTLTSIKDNKTAIPGEFALYQNYPNPFNPVTTIKYYIPVRTNVLINIYDILGRKITTLVNKIEYSGLHSVQFNASGLPSGVYIYSIITEQYTMCKKLLYMK